MTYISINLLLVINNVLYTVIVKAVFFTIILISHDRHTMSF